MLFLENLNIFFFYIVVIYTVIWYIILIIKSVFQVFQIQEVDLEEYLEKTKTVDQVILPNNPEIILFYLGILLMIWNFAVWGLLQFETTYVFVESLNEFFPAKGFYNLGFSWIVLAYFSFFSRVIEYCLGENKKNN